MLFSSYACQRQGSRQLTTKNPTTFIKNFPGIFSTLSWFCLVLTVCSGYFSISVQSIALISGLVFWFIALAKKELKAFNPELKLMNYLLVIQLLVFFVLHLVRADDLVTYGRNLISNYLQWFWFGSLFCLAAPRLMAIRIYSYASAALTLIIFLQILGIAPSLNGKIFGLLEQPFTSSALLIFGNFITLYLFRFGINKSFFESKIFYGCCFAANSVAIFALGQRSSIVGFLVGVVVYLLVSRSINIKQKFLSLAALATGLVAAYEFSPRLKRKILKVLSPDKIFSNKSMLCRETLWQENLDLWRSKLDYVFLGLGKIQPLECMNSTLTHMHNIYLQQLCKKGIFAFSSWMLFNLGLVYSLIKRIPHGALAFLCAFIAISCEGLFENWWGDSEVLCAFMFTMLFALVLPKN